MSGQLALWSSSEGHPNSSPPGSDPSSDTARAKLAPRAVRRQLMVADSVALLLGFGLAFAIQAVARPLTNYGVSQHLTLMIFSLPGFAFGAAHARLHQARANDRPTQESLNVLRSIAIGVAVMVLLAFVLQFKE